jgi:predicted DNA binding CopG/RHH family protein
MEKNEIIDFTQDSEYISMYNPLMAKAKKDHQINIRVSKDDLDHIDAKAQKYGMTRSSFVKYAALNVEFTIAIQEQIRKPEI